jgi:hypothetical protein
MDFTSCQGQPVMSDRPGKRAASANSSALAGGIKVVRAWIIVSPITPASIKAGQNLFHL